MSEFLSEFLEVFTEKLSCMKDYKVHLLMPESVSLCFFKARLVPYSIRARVEEELDKLRKQSVEEIYLIEVGRPNCSGVNGR